MGQKIAEWADWGEHIPIKCSECGALFHTKNIGHIGDRSIFNGFNGEGREKAEKCKCDFNKLQPDHETWLKFFKFI